MPHVLNDHMSLKNGTWKKSRVSFKILKKISVPIRGFWNLPYFFHSTIVEGVIGI